MKLEALIEHGIFIIQKLYAIKEYNGKVIIKASGTNKKELTFDTYVRLLNGKIFYHIMKKLLEQILRNLKLKW